MQRHNIQSLERLSLFCHISGLITIFLGVLIVFMELLSDDPRHIQIGLFIIVTGYTFVKISSQISQVLNAEK